MKKNNVLAVILEIAIVIVLVLIGVSPFFKNRNLLVDEALKPLNSSSGSFGSKNKLNPSNNIVFIELGVNSLIDGEGAILQDNDIKINQGGTYNLTGHLVNGSIYIDTKESVTLNLNGIDIKTYKEGINIKEAQEIIINLPEGSQNYISNDNNPAIFSQSPLTFMGDGKLVVNATKKSLDAQQGYTIKGGELIFFGQDKIVQPKDTTQNVLNFNLPSVLDATLISLENEDETTLVQENVLNNVKNIMISGKNIFPGTYYLYQTKENEKAKIVLNSLDKYEVKEKINWFE